MEGNISTILLRGVSLHVCGSGWWKTWLIAAFCCCWLLAGVKWKLWIHCGNWRQWWPKRRRGKNKSNASKVHWTTWMNVGRWADCQRHFDVLNLLVLTPVLVLFVGFATHHVRTHCRESPSCWTSVRTWWSCWWRRSWWSGRGGSRRPASELQNPLNSPSWRTGELVQLTHTHDHSLTH